MSISRIAIDKMAGQTPCLCGDVDAWHQECYAGKTADQIKVAQESAYRIASATLKRRSKTASTPTENT